MYISDELSEIVGAATAMLREKFDQSLPGPYEDDINLAVQLAEQSCDANRDEVRALIITLKRALMSPDNKESRTRLLAVYYLLRATEALFCATRQNQDSHVVATKTFALQAVNEAEQLPPVRETLN